jgi:hypothetical protein
MASAKAPRFEKETKRAPLDLISVIDRYIIGSFQFEVEIFAGVGVCLERKSLW